jgi:hypothetical protein
MGASGRAVWGLYGLLPLLLIPAAAGAFTAFRVSDEGGMRVALLLAGNYLGEFVGELCLNAFFILSARAMWRSTLLPRWVAGFGLACGMLGLIAMWRNVAGVVAPVAALNNAVLPLWMIVFGLGLMKVGSGHGRAQIGGLAEPLGR